MFLKIKQIRKRENNIAKIHNFHKLLKSKSTPSLLSFNDRYSINSNNPYDRKVSNDYSITAPTTAISNYEEIEKIRKRDVIKYKINELFNRTPGGEQLEYENFNYSSGLFSAASLQNDESSNSLWKEEESHSNSEERKSLLSIKFVNSKSLIKEDIESLINYPSLSSNSTESEPESLLLELNLFKIDNTFKNTIYNATFRKLQRPYFNLLPYYHNDSKRQRPVKKVQKDYSRSLTDNNTISNHNCLIDKLKIANNDQLSKNFYSDLRKRLIKIRTENNPLSRSTDF